MIVWLNGTFGAGKTTTSKELAQLIPQANTFDAEQIGYMLPKAVTGLPPVDDFQDWRPWRSLVVGTASELLGYLGGVLIVVQTVLDEGYWAEIRGGLERAGIPVRHFVLHTDQETLGHRIENDAETAYGRQWRLRQLTAYREAQAWMHREGEVIDTTHRTPREAAQLIAASASTGAGAGASASTGA